MQRVARGHVGKPCRRERDNPAEEGCELEVEHHARPSVGSSAVDVPGTGVRRDHDCELHSRATSRQGAGQPLAVALPGVVTRALPRSDAQSRAQPRYATGTGHLPPPADVAAQVGIEALEASRLFEKRRYRITVARADLSDDEARISAWARTAQAPFSSARPCPQTCLTVAGLRPQHSGEDSCQRRRRKARRYAREMMSATSRAVGMPSRPSRRASGQTSAAKVAERQAFRQDARAPVAGAAEPVDDDLAQRHRQIRQEEHEAQADRAGVGVAEQERQEPGAQQQQDGRADGQQQRDVAQRLAHDPPLRRDVPGRGEARQEQDVEGAGDQVSPAVASVSATT